MTRLTFAGLAGLICLVAAPPARAQLAFTFGQNGTQVTTVTATQGSSASVQVFLSSVADARFTDHDLFVVGTRLTTTGGFAKFDAITPATVANGGAFNSNQPNNLQPGQVKVLGDGAAPVAFAPTDRILLGTFTFTPTAVGTFTITAADFDPDPRRDDSVAVRADFTDAIVLDSSITNGSITLTILPVPEPVSVLAIGAAALGAWRLRRRVGFRSF